MMSGLLFIFIIMLAIFVINFKQAISKVEQKQAEAEKIIDGLTANNKIRKGLLENIKFELTKQDINVDIDAEHGVLRLKEEAIQFESGEALLNEEQLTRLKIIGNILSKILPCYANNAPVSDMCDKRSKGKVDSIFIEGHTDNVPIVGKLLLKYKDNWELAAERSIFTFRELVQKDDLLFDMVNLQQLPVFSVSGYGDGRPVPGHEHIIPTNDPENRRIDIRFIMTPPSITDPQTALEGNFN
jgi:flagellar motor protein MotB